MKTGLNTESRHIRRWNKSLVSLLIVGFIFISFPGLSQVIKLQDSDIPKLWTLRDTGNELTMEKRENILLFNKLEWQDSVVYISQKYACDSFMLLEATPSIVDGKNSLYETRILFVEKKDVWIFDDSEKGVRLLDTKIRRIRCARHKRKLIEWTKQRYKINRVLKTSKYNNQWH